MKKLYKDIRKTSFFLITTFMISIPISSAKVSPEARVDYVIGRAFLRNAAGDIKELKKGDHLYHLSEVNTEEGSLVGFSNFYDQQFSLSGSGYIKLYKDIIELRSGYLWVESVTVENSKVTIQTPNAKVSYKKGIAILSYDQFAEKTQILTTQGRFNLMNIFEDHLRISVSTGEFSFISKDYENGMPRKPTPAGQSTFLKITGLFSERPTETSFTKNDSSYRLVTRKTIKDEKLKNRIPTSILSDGDSGQIIQAYNTKLKYGHKEKDLMALSRRNIASLKAKIKPKKKAKFNPTYKKHSNVVIRVFGQKTIRKTRVQAKRKHKTVERKVASVLELNDDTKIDKSAFDTSLFKEYKNQMRHSKQMNSLIRDLKAYDQDYKQSY